MIAAYSIPGGERGPVAPWVERVPPGRVLAWAGAGLAMSLIAFGLLIDRDPSWVGMAEVLVALAVLLAVFLVRLRLGPILSIAAVTIYGVVEAIGGSFADGVALRPLGLGFALLAATFSASYVVLGIRRRDAELAVSSAAIGELTRRDRITELLSGGQELTWLDTELARSRRHDHRLALVLIRPDAVEEFEAEGEEIALRVLEALAAVIGSELRATDIALRRSVFVFSVILPETPADGARVAAERIRLSLAARVRPRSRPLTISAGVAAFPRDANTNEELIRIAESALTRAAELGGNRTLCASLEPGAPVGWTIAGTAQVDR